MTVEGFYHAGKRSALRVVQIPPKQLERLGGKLNEDYHNQGLLWKLSGSAGG